jgi:hypothetical protein
MITANARKRLESIEKEVIPSMFVGVLSKEDEWFKHTLEETLPHLEERALHLAHECKKSGECKNDETLCDESRISELFKETRKKLEKEHIARESRTRFHH